MKRSHTHWFTCATLALALQSCGTILSRDAGRGPGAMAPETGVYRGAIIDLQLLGTPLFPLGLLDLPLSLAADTILLPYDLVLMSTHEPRAVNVTVVFRDSSGQPMPGVKMRLIGPRPGGVVANYNVGADRSGEVRFRTRKGKYELYVVHVPGEGNGAGAGAGRSRARFVKTIDIVGPRTTRIEVRLDPTRELRSP